MVYLVSGGGGAVPYEVDRTPSDLYQSADFPNYHYVRFELHGDRVVGEMIRLEDYAAPAPGAGKPGIASSSACGLDGLNQLTHGRLCVAIQHARLIEHEQRIVDAGEALALAALDDDDVFRLVRIQDRHAVISGSRGWRGRPD